MPRSNPTEARRGPPDHIERLRVRFSDTDGMGIAHHSNYFRWLEEARLGFLRGAGFAYAEVERSGLHMPLIECACRYLAGTRSEDQLEICLWVAHVSRAGIGFEYEVRLEGSGDPIAVANTVHAFTRDDGRPTRIEPDSAIWRWLSGIRARL